MTQISFEMLNVPAVKRADPDGFLSVLRLGTHDGSAPTGRDLVEYLVNVLTERGSWR